MLSKMECQRVIASISIRGIMMIRHVVTNIVIILALLMPSSIFASTISVIYTYDIMGRVATALYSNNICVVYIYDGNGNRTSQIFNTSSGPGTATWGSDAWGCFKWTP